jgi:hypothetical protein
MKSVINKGQTNNTEVKYKATFTAAIRHLTPAVVKGKHVKGLIPWITI